MVFVTALIRRTLNPEFNTPVSSAQLLEERRASVIASQRAMDRQMDRANDVLRRIERITQ